MKARLSLAAALFALQCLANELISPDKVEADIKTEELHRVLWNLNKIAQDNGGTRAFGTPGYKASVDFIVQRAVERFGEHMDTTVQPFENTFEQTRRISVKGPDGEVLAKSAMFNPPTPLPDGITAPLIDTPVNDTSGSGCYAEDWAGVNATGKLALVKRGICAVAEKLKLARSRGALGVILWNQDPGTNYTSPTLGESNRTLVVPVGIVSQDLGLAWKARLAKGENVTVTLVVDTIYENRTTWNVISETKSGDPNNVIMLGAHLDSVQEGPGINDDGSGSAALLEIMGSFKQYELKNKVRFAWWGDEEDGLVGSLYYTSQLTPADADKIRYYFNYDMIGSIVPDYIVYDGEKIGTTKLQDYLKSKGANATLGKFGQSSDYVGFLRLGIPSSGLFTGAGDPQDPCYHEACDNLDNIHWEALTLNTKAAARVAAEFALSLEGVPRRNASASVPSRRSAMAIESWESLMASVQGVTPCSHAKHEHTTV